MSMIFDNIKNGINDILYDGAASLLDKCFGSDQMKSVSKLLYLNGDAYNNGSFWSTVNAILKVIEPFGYALIATFFLLFMLDLASKDQLTIDTIIKSMIQLIIVVTVAGNISTIINTLLSIGESMVALLDALTLAGSDSGLPTAETMVQDAKDSGVGGLTILLESAICWLVHQIAIIAIDLAAISRAIDVGWRCAFVPIGIANSFEGGTNSSGVRFLKGLAGAILCGAVMWAICALGFAVSAGFLTTDAKIGNLWVSVAATFATAGACIGATNKVKEVVG